MLKQISQLYTGVKSIDEDEKERLLLDMKREQSTENLNNIFVLGYYKTAQDG